MTTRIRIARTDDEGALTALIERSTRKLLIPFLTSKQIEASLEAMTLDRRLIEDGTYFVAEIDGVLVACGGWGRRREYAMAHAGARRKADGSTRGETPLSFAGCTPLQSAHGADWDASFSRPANARCTMPDSPGRSCSQRSRESRSTLHTGGKNSNTPLYR